MFVVGQWTIYNSAVYTAGKIPLSRLTVSALTARGEGQDVLTQGSLSTAYKSRWTKKQQMKLSLPFLWRVLYVGILYVAKNLQLLFVLSSSCLKCWEYRFSTVKSILVNFAIRRHRFLSLTKAIVQYWRKIANFLSCCWLLLWHCPHLLSHLSKKVQCQYIASRRDLKKARKASCLSLGNGVEERMSYLG